jgi:hypothetical protein
MSGLAGRTFALLLLLPLLPKEGFGPLHLTVKFLWCCFTCERDPHVPQCARGVRDLPLAVVGHDADFWVFVATAVGHAHLPWRFTGQTLLCLALASCVDGTNGVRYHKSMDLAILTSLASLANFASLEVFSLLSFASIEVFSSLLEVTLTLSAPLVLSSPLEVALSLALGGVLNKLVDDRPGDNPPVPSLSSCGPVGLREAAGGHVAHAVDV